MPKKWVEKKIKKIVKKMFKNWCFVEFLQFFDDFQHFLKKITDFFSTNFFGNFELLWQCSKFWLRWINLISSKSLSQ